MHDNSQTAEEIAEGIHRVLSPDGLRLKPPEAASEAAKPLRVEARVVKSPIRPAAGAGLAVRMADILQGRMASVPVAPM